MSLEHCLHLSTLQCLSRVNGWGCLNYSQIGNWIKSTHNRTESLISNDGWAAGAESTRQEMQEEREEGGQGCCCKPSLWCAGRSTHALTSAGHITPTTIEGPGLWVRAYLVAVDKTLVWVCMNRKKNSSCVSPSRIPMGAQICGCSGPCLKQWCCHRAHQSCVLRCL